MQKNFWSTILDESLVGTFPEDKIPEDVKRTYKEMMMQLSINKALDSITFPDHGDYFIDFADLNIPHVSFADLPKMTLEDNFEMKLVGDSRASSPRSAQKILKNEAVNSTSTSTSSQRQQNIELLEEFNRKQQKFVYLLHHTNFEDGIDNEATEFFYGLFKQDPCISLFWLSGVYTDNQEDVAVIEGILRIISLLDAVEYRKYVLPLVKASFNDQNIEVQEAAIMVAENWRNKMCLDALQTNKFASTWIQDYANQIIEELKEELMDEISKND